MARRKLMLAASLAASLGIGTVLSITTSPPIWVARPKRGNRRNRSRWNYNR